MAGNKLYFHIWLTVQEICIVLTRYPIQYRKVVRVAGRWYQVGVVGHRKIQMILIAIEPDQFIGTICATQ